MSFPEIVKLKYLTPYSIGDIGVEVHSKKRFGVAGSKLSTKGFSLEIKIDGSERYLPKNAKYEKTGLFCLFVTKPICLFQWWNYFGQGVMFEQKHHPLLVLIITFARVLQEVLYCRRITLLGCFVLAICINVIFLFQMLYMFLTMFLRSYITVLTQKPQPEIS